jgi:diguanylate cyclase (GGDEF)-like protein/PAS domain S-box-containing protein
MRATALRVQLVILLVLSVTLVWAFAFYELRRAEANTLEAAQAQSRGLAQAMAENTISTIKRIDLVLLELVRTWEADRAGFAAEIRRHQEYIADLAIQVAVTDETGTLVFSNLEVPKQRLSLADREHIRAQLKATESRLFISAPVLGRVSGKWSIQFTRPVIVEGRFSGIVVISVSPELFSRFYRTLSLPSDCVTMLVRDSGEILARAPVWEPYIGRSLSDSPYLAADVSQQGNFQRISHLDGVDRVSGYHKLPDYGLTVVVGRSLVALRTPETQTTHIVIGIAALISVLFAFSAIAFWRSLLARERAESQVRDLNAELEHRVSQRTDELARANTELSLAASVFRNTMEGVAITDPTPRIVWVNPAFSAITGYAAEEAVGQNPSILRSAHHGVAFYRNLWEALTRDGYWQGEIWNRRKNGEAYLEWLTINRISDEAGNALRYVSVFHDITESRRKDEHIEHLAFHDALTGLANRSLLQDRLNHAVERAQREGGRLAVMFIDLDRFKAVNDGLGHNVGDQLLQEVAQRLSSRLRTMDTVARMGGDEFVVLMEDLHDPSDCAQRAEDLLQAIAEPMEIAGHRLQVGASIGVAFYPEDCVDSVELMKRADAAMYAAKAAGRNTYRFFQSAMLEQTTHRLNLEMALREAATAGQLLLHYQPKVNLASGKLEGVEALVRWNHPQRGMVSPGEFISVAEESGLIGVIGGWVIDEVCRQLADWRARGLPPMRVAFNVSAKQLGDGNLAERILAATRAVDIAPALLEVELTESVVMANPEHVAQLFARLRRIGVTIAIDDFGTGYSSLAYLRRLPIDVLKIDRTFVAAAEREDEDAQIVITILALANALKLTAVAEGVETAAQRDLLKYLGCDLAQGYFFSRPLPAPEIEQWLVAQS